MPQQLWCQSDPIVKLTYKGNNARYRIIVGATTPPPLQVVVPIKPIHLLLKTTLGVQPKVQQQKDDPLLPCFIALATDTGLYAPSLTQTWCELLIEAPAGLFPTNLYVTVEDQTKHSIAFVTIDTMTDPTQPAHGSLIFLAQYAKELPQEEAFADSSTWT